MNRNVIIDLKNVTVVRGNRKILAGINWTVLRGRFCTVIGPNGAGKSALVAVLSGYLWPQDGSVSVLGKTYGDVELQKVRSEIGLIEPSRMPQFDETMTVRNIIATGLFGTVVLPPNKKVSKEQWNKIDSQISFFKLEKQKSVGFGTLSTGEQTKVFIARAMVSRPTLLILDEPTSGLDMGNRTIVVKMLNKLHKHKNPPTVIIVSHHLDELPKYLDQAVLLKNGRIVEQGKPQNVLTSSNLSKTFNCKVEVIKKNGSYLSSVRT